MNILVNALAVLVVLALLAAFGAGGYYALEYVAALFASLESEMARGAVLVSLVALFAAVVIGTAVRVASGRIKAGKLSAEKGATYRLFAELWEHLLAQGGGPENRNTDEVARDLRTLELMLSLYGSAAVIRAHTALRALAREGGAQDEQLRHRFIAALAEIRQDLGADTRSLPVEALRELLLPGGRGTEVATPAKGSRFSEALAAKPE